MPDAMTNGGLNNSIIFYTSQLGFKAISLYKLQVTLNYGYDGLIPNMELQDKIAAYYADVCFINGLGYYDFDGQEFLFNNGHGYYSAKRFFRKMFEREAS